MTNRNATVCVMAMAMLSNAVLRIFCLGSTRFWPHLNSRLITQTTGYTKACEMCASSP